jgi:hypothetical protein
VRDNEARIVDDRLWVNFLTSSRMWVTRCFGIQPRPMQSTVPRVIVTCRVCYPNRLSSAAHDQGSILFLYIEAQSFTQIKTRAVNFGELEMVNLPARFLGVILSLAFFVFSVVMFFKTWDWVAAVFALGSLGYSLFFIHSYQRNKS